MRSTVARALSRFVENVAPKHPAQYVASAFVLAIAVTTVLLMLPVSQEPGTTTPLRTAIFTATSAVCVIGLTVVDTEQHWSVFGEIVIMGAMQVGGIGIMTMASLLALLVSRRIGLKSRITTSVEAGTFAVGDVRRLLRNVAITLLVLETALALILFLRFWVVHGIDARHAAYSGIFHSVSAANNAGFYLYSDSLSRFVHDPVVSLSVAAVVILSSLGFPVLFELAREWRAPRSWSIHTKITLLGTGLLLAGGTFMITLFEWTNPRTLGPLDSASSILAGFFQAVTPRSAGFNTVDIGGMYETTWLGLDVLMFIGGGSGGTAGGIKVTTFMVLFFAILAEARGDESVDAFDRRLPQSVLRLAISVALLGVAVVVMGTMFLLATTHLDLDRVLFEVCSAFGTAGLSTGITPTLPPTAQYVLVAIMFVGRIGTITLASALAMRTRRRLYRLPEGQPIVG